MKVKNIRRGLAALVLLLVSTTGLRAQLTGSIEGVVTDASGQAVSGAQVRVLETTTNSERLLDTGRDGRYTAAALAPGQYLVEIARAGFEVASVRALTLNAGRTLRADVRLKIETSRQSVVVTAKAQQIDAAPGAWGGSVGDWQLASLPLNGRNVFDLASQQVGATAPAAAQRTMSAGLGLHISVNGSRPSENSFRLDGIYINDATGNAPTSSAGNLLGIETLAEVRVVASPFSAEYGRSAGGVLTAVSKSGTNALHGSVYEYLRNSALDAKSFFDPAGKTPPFRRNQFGSLVSGPVVKDRLFFLLNYEGARIFSSTTQTSATPNEQARKGILPVNGVLVSVPVSTAILPYLDLYPLPNGPDLGNGVGRYTSSVPSATREDYGAGKLDFIASDRWRFSGRYTYDSSNRSSRDPFDLWSFLETSHYNLAQATAQYVPSASVIHEFRAAFSQISNRQVAASSGIPASLSFVPGQPPGPIAVVGLTDFGGQIARNQPRQFETTAGQMNYSQMRIRGAHKFSFGAGYDRILLREIAEQDRNSYYQFSSLRNFLAGKPRSVSLMLPGSTSLRHWGFHQFSGYAQDDVRLTGRLSLSAGVRYETATTPVERDGRVATLPDPLHDSQVTTGGSLFVNPSHWNFAPRLSLAWDAFGNGRTVVRAGSGIFYGLLGTRELIIAGLRMPPYYYRAVVSGAAFPNALSAVQGALPVPSVDGFTYHPNQPYTAQFHIAVERALGQNIVTQVGYAGSRGIHLVGDVQNLNTTQPQVLDGGQLFFPANGTAINPNFGQIGMRVTNFDSSYHSLNASIQMSPARGLRMQGKFTWSKSIDDDSIVIFNDTYATNAVPTVFDYRQNRGPSDYNCPFVFAANFFYQTRSVGPRAVRAALGGWELSGISQAQSGTPFNPTVGFDNARLRGTSTDLGQRPNLVLTGQPIVTGDPRQYFNPLAFSLPAAGTLGTLGRNVLQGPSLVFLSAAVERAVWKTERQALRLRAEVFNLANHPNFQMPSGLALFDSTGARVGTAGQITETTTSSRQIQLSARFAF